MKNTKDLFNKFISFENNYNEIKKSSVDDYIYEQESNINFAIFSYRLDSERRNIIMQYLQNESETIEKIYREYINDNGEIERLRWYENNNPYHEVSVKDYIGVRLQQQELYEKLKKELEQNPNNEYKKKHDIIKSMKNLDAQMITITIKHKVIEAIVDDKRTLLLKDKTKNKSSYRSLPLIQEIKDALLEHKKKIENNKKLCGNSYMK